MSLDVLCLHNLCTYSSSIPATYLWCSIHHFLGVKWGELVEVFSFQQAVDLSFAKMGTTRPQGTSFFSAQSSALSNHPGRGFHGKRTQNFFYQVSFWQTEAGIVISALPPVWRIWGRISQSTSPQRLQFPKHFLQNVREIPEHSQSLRKTGKRTGKKSSLWEKSGWTEVGRYQLIKTLLCCWNFTTRDSNFVQLRPNEFLRAESYIPVS